MDPTLLAAVIGAVSTILGVVVGIAATVWWNRKADKQERAMLLMQAGLARATLNNQGNSLMIEPGSEDYQLAERAVSKGYLKRMGPGIYCLPDFNL